MRQKQNNIIKLIGDGHSANNDAFARHLFRRIENLLVHIVLTGDERIKPKKWSRIIALFGTRRVRNDVNYTFLTCDFEHVTECCHHGVFSSKRQIAASFGEMVHIIGEVPRCDLSNILLTKPFEQSPISVLQTPSNCFEITNISLAFRHHSRVFGKALDRKMVEGELSFDRPLRFEQAQGVVFWQLRVRL